MIQLKGAVSVFCPMNNIHLAENINQPAVDPASACHNTVARKLGGKIHLIKLNEAISFLM